MKEITIRTNTSVEGVKKIEKLWKKMFRGKISLFEKGDVMPIVKYSNFVFDENINFDVSILVVDYNFMQQLERGCMKKKYKKYDFCFDDFYTIPEAMQSAWKQVVEDTQEGRIKRNYFEDYGYTIPAKFSRDNKLHCLLYISLETN